MQVSSSTTSSSSSLMWKNSSVQENEFLSTFDNNIINVDNLPSPTINESQDVDLNDKKKILSHEKRIKVSLKSKKIKEYKHLLTAITPNKETKKKINSPKKKFDSRYSANKPTAKEYQQVFCSKILEKDKRYDFKDKTILTKFLSYIGGLL